jgi:hypothetical protein
MKKTILLLTAIGTVSVFLPRHAAVAGPVDQFQILTGFSAKEVCSCAFVVEQTDEYCKAFGKLEGYDVESVIDRNAKTVTSTFLLTSRTARFEDGCVLQAP